MVVQIANLKLVELVYYSNHEPKVKERFPLVKYNCLTTSGHP